MASDEPQPSTKMMDEGVPSDREACDEAESDLGVGWVQYATKPISVSATQ